MPKRRGPIDGWPARRQVFVQFGDAWVQAGGPLGIEGYHHWFTWPGVLDLGVLRPRGCPGRLIEVADALPDHPAEAGLLVALGAELAHVCHRLHHYEPGHGWCWCDACFDRRTRERAS